MSHRLNEEWATDTWTPLDKLALFTMFVLLLLMAWFGGGQLFHWVMS
jgi:hypothetical protein